MFWFVFSDLGGLRCPVSLFFRFLSLPTPLGPDVGGLEPEKVQNEGQRSHTTTPD